MHRVILASPEFEALRASLRGVKPLSQAEVDAWFDTVRIARGAPPSTPQPRPTPVTPSSFWRRLFKR